MENQFRDEFGLVQELSTSTGPVRYISLPKLNELTAARRLPFSIQILMESVVRRINGAEVTREHAENFFAYQPENPGTIEIPFTPARVLLQDFTGVPCVVDLAAMRSAMQRLNGDPSLINPQLPVNLVIDHSVSTDSFNSPLALQQNSDLEFSRNRERYEFLRWGQASFSNFDVVPPASGICHQVNLEYLGKVVQLDTDQEVPMAYPDSLVGTDSHTPMINGLGIVGWGVGGIEAEAAMLGQPIYMLAPSVVGVRISGKVKAGITATDIVLTITEMLRKHGVVGKFVEFFGQGLASMSVPDRATLSNMAPEYGATVGYFPVDQKTLDYMYSTGRPEELIELVEKYTKAQGLFRTEDTPDPEFETILELDLSSVESSISGPKRPQDRITLKDVKKNWQQTLGAPIEERGFAIPTEKQATSVHTRLADGSEAELTHGDVAIASITSCTNTSNPSVLLSAGILARKAAEKGLKTKPWVKTSFAPGSLIVTDYLKTAGLMPYLEELGYYLVGYGCMTCIGNSGPLPKEVSDAVEQGDLVAAGVLSGNRNFEGRINPHTRANYLASPPLVVAYGLAGTVNIDFDKEPIGQDPNGNDVFLRDIWPDDEEILRFVDKALDRDAFIKSYTGLEESNEQWNAIPVATDALYAWEESSSYIQEPDFFAGMQADPGQITAITGARVLVKAGDSITTDHISPAGAIDPSSPAGLYLQSLGIQPKDFNSYGSRRGNDRVMTRGTFANIRFRNQLAPGTTGSATTYFPSREAMSIYDAGMRYKAENVPAIVLAGKDYGMGSSRDWAAKGPFLMGIRAVIAESYERIHRSNLVGMGILPLQFKNGETAETLGLDGSESYDIMVDDSVKPGQLLDIRAISDSGKKTEFQAVCRIDSTVEVEYYRHGGILHRVLRNKLSSN
ncbi:aconitate hydratase AcnA [Spirochaeta dissipatitropha]